MRNRYSVLADKTFWPGQQRVIAPRGGVKVGCLTSGFTGNESRPLISAYRCLMVIAVVALRRPDKTGHWTKRLSPWRDEDAMLMWGESRSVQQSFQCGRGAK